MIGEDRGRTNLSPDQDPQGGSRQHRLSIPIVKVVSPFVGPTPTTTVYVRNPSARLRCMLALGYQLDSGENGISDVAAWTATLYAWVKTQAGVYLPSNQIIPGPAALSTALPWSYEASTLVSQLRCFITVPDATHSTARPGTLWATASWEPESGAIIGDGELADMFKQASISGDEIQVGGP